ncbi:MAG: thermonuclease family protein [Rhodospirillaceae bacterium]|jgi:endonuclease YncB( thermonuclease family)|nr:thermonuclease family protein [Rhodospirillaceae bacterium]MBT3885926.1 thermonuclease family protein [Rhodospirillaceae bacterium]MBT4115270.1 thermonuclease family protein [Rhodospirillaceae bacterium]MBT4673725.1 thermonuclease family protein [Rhodospirillaceae bacterium]MBT4718548.1 thermonuclease family protein [Rhodospirillaceae bacterium]
MLGMRRILSLLAAAAIVIFATRYANGEEYSEEFTGVPYTIDAGTIRIGNVAIRLHGIDAPAPKKTCKRADGKLWRCGWEATMALANIVGEHWVICKPARSGAAHPVAAVCRAGVLDINEWMVRNGWAEASRRTVRGYGAAEREAMKARRGIWQGRPIR